MKNRSQLHYNLAPVLYILNIELVKTNHYKEDRTIRDVKYNENIGAYRIEEHEIIE